MAQTALIDPPVKERVSVFTQKKKYTGSRQRSVKLGIYKIIVLYAAISGLYLLITFPDNSPLNWWITVMWSIHIFAAGIGVFQAVNRPKMKMSTYKGVVEDYRVVFLIPTVCREDTMPALRRVLDSILHYAPRNLRDFRIDVIVEDGSEGLPELMDAYGHIEEIRVVVMPASYKTQNGTKYKARANQYALELRRDEKENTENVYVHYLDDDTMVKEDTIASIAEFIARHHDKYYLAQGIPAFPHDLSPSRFCKLADSIRPMDDMTRLGFFTDTIGTPLAGLHGEHLLIRADIEDTIGWDLGDTIVEDAVFALHFSKKYPGKSRQLNSFSYGASPGNIKDLIAQRKRWSSGLLKLVFNREFPLRLRIPLFYCSVAWSLGFFQFVGVVALIAYATGVNNTSPVAIWVLFLWAFNFSYFVWMYMEGLKINMSVTEKHEKTGKTSLWNLFFGGFNRNMGSFSSQAKYALGSLAMIPLIYAFTLVEGLASFLGLMKFVSRGKSEFVVIEKRS